MFRGSVWKSWIGNSFPTFHCHGIMFERPTIDVPYLLSIRVYVSAIYNIRGFETHPKEDCMHCLRAETQFWCQTYSYRAFYWNDILESSISTSNNVRDSVSHLREDCVHYWRAEPQFWCWPYNYRTFFWASMSTFPEVSWQSFWLKSWHISCLLVLFNAYYIGKSMLAPIKSMVS